MSHSIVKITIDDDGEVRDEKWCLVDPGNFQGPATLCTVEFFGYGESNCIYKLKEVKRGGITCEKCIEILKSYKRIRM